MGGRCVGNAPVQSPTASASARRSPPICWRAAGTRSCRPWEDQAVAESAALRGRRIVVTRAGEAGTEFAARLRQLGAEPILAPAIAILPPDDFGPLDAAIAALTAYDAIVFTSANGVKAFLERLRVG